MTESLVADQLTDATSAIQNAGDAEIINSTFSGNRGFVQGTTLSNSGTMRLEHCTFSGNSSSDVGKFSEFDGTVEARNCIFGQYRSGDAPAGLGKLVSRGFNLILYPTAYVISGDETGNIYGVDPLLSPLRDNGGPVYTHAPVRGSPTIDQGMSGGQPTDQRGFPRILDFSELPNAADGADIGAVESGPRELRLVPGHLLVSRTT